MVFGSLFRSAPKPGGKILVAFASQTGAAERIAWLSANALASSGSFVRVAALGGLAANDLAEAGTLLVVTSTYGAGEAPDSARAFARKQMAQTPSLKGLRYAVLALGDKKYDATFCGFGRGVDRWLAAGRAARLFDVICVNGDDDDAAMTRWCEQLTKLGADTSVEQLMPGAPQDWIVDERRLLNPGSPGGEAWHIALVPKNPAHLHWNAGDIAEIWPRNSEAAVDAFLAQHKLDGTLSFKWRGHWTFLRDIIAHSRLPKPHEVEGISVQWLVERLEGFGAREYSIASLPDSGRMELVVRKAVKDDGSLGLGSGWLTETSAMGGVIKLRLRPNPNFQPPADGPQILIGAGTGFAGLRAHLFYRQKKKLGDAWLLFGERARARDLYYGDELAAWQADGTLARTDLVFSRDSGSRKYVQHLVADAGGEIGAFVERGASVLVCGGLSMAAGVQEALVGILGEEKLEQMTQNGLYRRDIY
ncbi:MAG TPA: sulfite reductase flavoprotein subunit alpha [Rhizomicrobium sp.]|jgi:sulfite reductase (NADPH) flavoprotein alpha-component|nr:sulfite reductase flavoprotein subunit alpha [Rhizomicrobium sp.]